MKEHLPTVTPAPWCFFTALGTGLLLFLLYLAILPVSNAYDVVATVITVSIGGFLLLVLFLGTWTGLTLRKSGPFSVTPSERRIPSSERTSLCVAIPRVWLPPFFRLRGEVSFEHEQPGPCTFALTDRFAVDGVRIFIPTTFPHRGIWSVKGVRWTIEDRLGLTRCRGFSAVLPSTIEVYPKPDISTDLPVVNSCSREGDLVSDPLHARGDLFDLKRYHPSDGLNKVVWKIYARRGELLSRHPEKTMTPEGRVLVLVLAHTSDDSCAALAIRYAEQITTLGLELSLLCHGASPTRVAHTTAQTEQLLIETAWGASLDVSATIDELLDGLSGGAAQGGAVTHIVVIGDVRSPLVHGLALAGDRLASRGIQPVFLVKHTPPLAIKSAPRGLKRILQKILLDESPWPYLIPSRDPTKFLSAASSNRWELYQQQ